MRKAMQAGIVAAGFAAAFGFFGQPGAVPVALAAAAQPAAQTVGAGQAALVQALLAKEKGDASTAGTGQRALSGVALPVRTSQAKTAQPGAYPMPGTYEISYSHIRLGSATPGAEIHYTLDGTKPTQDSPVFDPAKGAIPILEFGAGASLKPGTEKTVVVKAIAFSKGAAPSDVATLQYNFVVHQPGYFSYEVLREAAPDTPALIRISDYARVNMFLVVGSQRALLIDSGLDAKGDLYSLIQKLDGGLPFDVISLHGHADHAAQTQNFLDKHIKVYVPHKDLSWFGDNIPQGTLDPQEGDKFNLGNTVLTSYAVPGHTVGSLVLLDAKTGDLYSSDSLGSNDPLGPNSGLLDDVGLECSMDRYYTALVDLKHKLNGRAKRIFTGHNPLPLDIKYLDNLIATVKDALDRGESALVPSIRPPESTYGSTTMFGFGDYRVDPNSVAINPKYLHAKDALESPQKIIKGYLGPKTRVYPKI